MTQVKIISGFPGVGKTHYVNANPDTCIDSDSSNFSWLRDVSGNFVLNNAGQRVKNPAFVTEYVNYVEDQIAQALRDGKDTVNVFISMHPEIVDEFARRGLLSAEIYPDQQLREEYINRYKTRDTHPDLAIDQSTFANTLAANWETWTNTPPRQGITRIILQTGQYLSDVIKDVHTLPEAAIERLEARVADRSPDIKVRVISGYPGTGKTEYTADHTNQCLDIDSSQYSWLRDTQGNIRLDQSNNPTRNPNFLRDYVAGVKAAITRAVQQKKNDIVVFISTHPETVKAFLQEGILTSQVFPAQHLKNQYMKKYRTREHQYLDGSSGTREQFCALMADNWDEWTSPDNATLGAKRITLSDEKPFIDRAVIEQNPVLSNTMLQKLLTPVREMKHRGS